jgi:predicted nucleotidyltransferase
MFEEKVLPERIMFLRILALRYMELFAPFLPYLVGSVLTGVVTRQSDIDLHLFAESPEEVEQFLKKREIPFDSEVVSIRKGAEFLEYPHIYLEEEEVIIECTIYPPEERRKTFMSSITGKAMERADTKKLRRIVGAML